MPRDRSRRPFRIAAAQRVEHYEIAAYGTLVAWATAMGHGEAADLRQATLNEEKTADGTLTKLAESGVNSQAVDAGAMRAAGRDERHARDAVSRG